MSEPDLKDSLVKLVKATKAIAYAEPCPQCAAWRELATLLARAALAANVEEGAHYTDSHHLRLLVLTHELGLVSGWWREELARREG